MAASMSDPALVMVMEPADVGDGNDAAVGMNGSPVGRIKLQRLMTPTLVVVSRVIAKYTVPLPNWTAAKLPDLEGSSMSADEREVQRWTAGRKRAVVLEVLKGQLTGVDACRKNGIKQSELEEWTERFLEGGENALRSNPRDEAAAYEAKIKDLQAKVGELVLDRDILKKSLSLKDRPPSTS